MRILALLFLTLFLTHCGADQALITPDPVAPVTTQLREGRWGGFLNGLDDSLPPIQRAGFELDLVPPGPKKRAWVFHPNKQLERYHVRIRQTGNTIHLDLEPTVGGAPLAFFDGTFLDEDTLEGTLTDSRGSSPVVLRWLGVIPPVQARLSQAIQAQAEGAPAVPVPIFTCLEANPIKYGSVGGSFGFLVGLGVHGNEGGWVVAYADGGLFALESIGDNQQYSAGSSRFSTLVLEPDWITVDLFAPGDDGLTDYWAWFEVHGDDFGNFASGNWTEVLYNMYCTIYAGGEELSGTTTIYGLGAQNSLVAPPNAPSCLNNPIYGCTSSGSYGVLIDGVTYVVPVPYLNLLEDLGF